MPLTDITNQRQPVRVVPASKLFTSPQGKSAKAASPPSPAQLAAAYAVFTQQKANLLARTQHADVVIAAALRQLERQTANCTPPRPGAHQPSKGKGDPTNSAEKFHIVDRLHARSGSLLDVDALRRRNEALARKLHDAVDAAHRLQEKLSTHLGDVHGRSLQHTEEGASLEQAQEQLEQQAADPAAAAAITSPQRSPRAALKEGGAATAAAGGSSLPASRPPTQQLLLAGLQPIAVAGPRRAATAGSRQVLSARACPQEEQEQQQRQRFSMSVDWSTVQQLPAAERGQTFRPGTSVRDFRCHQEEVAAYLTTQQGLRDGKRRRLASGMLAHCLANRQPSAAALQGAGTVAQEGSADAVPSLQHTPGRARRTGLRRDSSSANVAAAAATVAAAAAGGEQGQQGAAAEAASPAAALPSRTPKRKRGGRSISEAEAAPAQAELEAAFSLLTTAEQPAADVVPVCDSPGTVTAVQMQALPYFHAATGLVVPIASSGSQQEEGKGKAAEGKEGKEGLEEEAEQQEFETLKLFDDLWLGGGVGGAGNSKAAGSSKASKEVLPPSKGSSMGSRPSSRRAPAGICAIS